jgi:hypothetical protein
VNLLHHDFLTPRLSKMPAGHRSHVRAWSSHSVIHLQIHRHEIKNAIYSKKLEKMCLCDRTNFDLSSI